MFLKNFCFIFFLPYFAYYVTDSFQLGRMPRSQFVESLDLAQNGDNSIDENGQHFDGEGIQSPGYGIKDTISLVCLLEISALRQSFERSGYLWQ